MPLFPRIRNAHAAWSYLLLECCCAGAHCRTAALAESSMGGCSPNDSPWRVGQWRHAPAGVDACRSARTGGCVHLRRRGAAYVAAPRLTARNGADRGRAQDGTDQVAHLAESPGKEAPERSLLRAARRPRRAPATLTAFVALSARRSWTLWSNCSGPRAPNWALQCRHCDGETMYCGPTR